MEQCAVFVTGGTGFVGQGLLRALQSRGHVVRALVRPGRESRIPPGVEPVVGDALNAETFSLAIPSGGTVVHLVGTPHPSPAKADAFLSVDLPSIAATVAAARAAGAGHLIYVSVAHPAPVMHAYIDVRKSGENLIRGSGMNATILRPWYILGPGHRWPYVLLPAYAVLRMFPRTREGALRLGLVTLGQMISALVRAVEDPPVGVRIIEVPGIRSARSVVLQ